MKLKNIRILCDDLMVKSINYSKCDLGSNRANRLVIRVLIHKKNHTRDEFSSKISYEGGMCNNGATSVSSVSAASIIPVSISLPLEACYYK